MSVARGDAREHSDVDVLIVVENIAGLIDDVNGNTTDTDA